ncbi:MarR family winged helix-turn-helix transcriptional regulator [Streptomyces sp. NBC_01190]|uniref:MarR family winged helix-turn-helix transcriptional regulator n=1 Tax=Streptomyces sp. NBC_01190 TaxID=2903767 RepID=UPI003866F2C8|nr:MarR family transcriptional regulator [Streptomyces sp. NBC_01190]
MTTTNAPRDSAASAADAGGAGGAGGATAADTAERVWDNLRSLVLGRNERRKEAAEALGMSFFRVKVLRRVAAAPARLSELAAELSSDRPYTTLVVDDLAKRGLVERRPHPTDGRCKIVSATAAGHAAADRANAILGTPPASLRALPAEDLAALDRIAAALAAAE